MKTSVLRMLFIAWLVAVLSTIGWGAEPSGPRTPGKSARGGPSAAAVVVVETPPEPQLSKVQAEALEMCLRIYRWYGSMEAVPVGKGVAVCR